MWRRKLYPLKSSLSVRYVSQVLAKTPQPMTSKEIRERFSRYFIEKHNHKFVRSSPVVPLCDPTVAFVNAGMNQVGGQRHSPSTLVINFAIFIAVQEHFPREAHSHFAESSKFPEVRPSRGEAQRLEDRRHGRVPSHVLRNAGQLVVRRLLQTGRL